MKAKPLLRSISVASFVALAAASATAVADSDRAEPHSSSVGVAIDDATITGKVKTKYMQDSRLKHSDVSVTTANGVVTLTGSAPSSEAKNAAAELARSVEGVSSVENDIHAPTVSTPSVGDKVESTTKHAAKKTERVASDSWITTKVKSSLLADSIVKGFNISVKTRHHIVSLSGTVDTQASIDHAADLAKQVKGVESVDTSGLQIGHN